MMTKAFIRSAAVLAGGEGRRMGFDKALLESPDGRSNLELLTDSLSARFDDVFVVRRRGLYEDSPLPPGVRVVYDIMDEPGPLTGIVSAMSYCECAYVFVCACDAQPILPAYLDMIIECAETYSCDAVLPRIGGFVQPFWSLYNTRMLPYARAAVTAGLQSPYRFIRYHNIHIMEESDVAAGGVPIAMFSNRNVV
jgi:molybdopterin-guanine dinucleotide biosynthesis protein A